MGSIPVAGAKKELRRSRLNSFLFISMNRTPHFANGKMVESARNTKETDTLCADKGSDSRCGCHSKTACHRGRLFYYPTCTPNTLRKRSAAELSSHTPPEVRQARLSGAGRGYSRESEILAAIILFIISHPKNFFNRKINSLFA